MAWETGSSDSIFQKGEEDSTKVVKSKFKKVDQLDITVPCSICDQAVHISQILHHKKAHQAQAVLDYQRPWVEPIDIKKITLQRKHLILRMLKTARYTERQREKIGCSFELLKKNLRVTPCFYIDSTAQSTVHVKEVSTAFIKGIAICQDKNAVWHTDLEDVFVVLDNYGSKAGTCFLGLFDGSNGISAAETTSAELPLLLLEQLSRDDPSYQVSQEEKKVLDSFRTIFRADYRAREKLFARKRARDKESKPTDYEWIHKAYAKSFWRMDRLLRLGRNEVSRVCWSSCSAATCLVEEVRDDKENQPDQEGEKTLEQVIDEKEPSIMQKREDMPRRITSKKKSATEEGSVLVNAKRGSIAEQQEEPLGKKEEENEQNKGNNTIAPEGNGQGANSKDEILKQNLSTNREQQGGLLGKTNNEEVKDTEQTENYGTQEENLPENIEPSLKESLRKTNNEILRDTEHITNSKEENPPEDREQSLNESLGKTNEELRGTEEITNYIDRTQEEILPENKEQRLKEQLGKTNDTKKKSISEPGDEQNVNSKDKIKGERTPEKNNSSAGLNEICTGLMHIANVGNVHAVLCKNGKSYWLTKEHSTYCREERIRVLRNGGYISSNEPKGLVEGLIKNTRGLGHHGNPKLKHTVIPVPHTISFPVDDSCQFLILASNGLWEVLDKNEAVLLALTMFSAYLEKYQHAQLKRNHRTLSPKLPLSDLEEEFYPLYANQDFFSEVDLCRSFNVQLRPTTNGPNKSELNQPGSFGESSEDESESFVEEIGGLWDSSDDTSYFESTQLSTSTSATQESSKQNQLSDMDTEEFQSPESSQTSEDSEMDSRSFYDLAAKYISKNLVKAALKAGSRDNITVLVALLNGCDKIPTYI